MMEPLRQPLAPLDEPQPAELADVKESPRTWQKPASRNYWAKLDQRDFARFPVVTPLPYLEESRLFERAQNGDTDARNILWQQHLRLAFSVVNRFHLPESLLADAIQEAALGLVVAIARFEVHRYNAFSTYAWYWMEQRVRRFRINHVYGVRIPAYLYPAYGRFHKGLRRCKSRADWFDWRDEWLSSDSNTFERLSRYHALAHAGPLGDADGTVADDNDPTNAIEHQETLSLVRTTVDHLPHRERHIITRRYGLDGEPEATLEEVGNEISLTRERVRQLEVEGMDAIRQDLEKRLAGRNGKCRDNHAVN